MVTANTFFRTHNLLFYYSAYIFVALLALLSTLLPIGVWTVPLLIFMLLLITITAAPHQLRFTYHRQRRLGIANRHYITVVSHSFLNVFISIALYAALYYQHGLVIEGVLSNVSWQDAVYFSGVTWTTVGYGDMLTPPSLLLIPTVEAINGYLAMAVMMALIFKHIDTTHRFEMNVEDGTAEKSMKD